MQAIGALGSFLWAVEAGHGGGDIGFVGALRGALVVIFAVLLFIGSVYYLLSTNVGARLSFLICAAILSGFMALLALVWATSSTPLTVPHGPQSHWVMREVTETVSDSSQPAVRRAGSSGRRATEAEGSEVKAVVDEALTSATSSFARFTSPSDYVVTDIRFVGGGKAGLVKHRPFYAVAELQSAKRIEVEPGSPPAPPEADPTKAKSTLILLRDLGSLRVPAYLTFLASLIFFGMSLAALSSTERAAAATAAARA
ncbi:MAG: hypothetical protein ACRDV9_03780 [Acidimicrobiia bacterium]